MHRVLMYSPHTHTISEIYEESEEARRSSMLYACHEHVYKYRYGISRHNYHSNQPRMERGSLSRLQGKVTWIYVFSCCCSTLKIKRFIVAKVFVDESPFSLFLHQVNTAILLAFAETIDRYIRCTFFTDSAKAVTIHYSYVTFWLFFKLYISWVEAHSSNLQMNSYDFIH